MPREPNSTQKLVNVPQMIDKEWIKESYPVTDEIHHKNVSDNLVQSKKPLVLKTISDEEAQKSEILPSLGKASSIMKGGRTRQRSPSPNPARQDPIDATLGH